MEMVDKHWRQIASPAEVEALTHMIEASERVRLLRVEFKAAQEVLNRFKIEVTRRMVDDGSLLMEEMTVAYKGVVYLITLDVDGDNGHEIRKIGSVINLD